MTNLRKSGGFTLIELMVTVSIAAILMVVGAPALEQTLASQRVKTVSYEIMADLTLARSEALKRGQDVRMTPAAGGWASGWTVSTTLTTPITPTVQEFQLSQKSPSGSRVVFTQSPATITFDRNGRVAGLSAVTRFGFSDGSVNKRCVSLDPTGRPKNAKTECPT
jgi:type IV fimbrial biogenesis protein FimT